MDQNGTEPVLISADNINLLGEDKTFSEVWMGVMVWK
jgi:hypothetical protein